MSDETPKNGEPPKEKEEKPQQEEGKVTHPGRLRRKQQEQEDIRRLEEAAKKLRHDLDPRTDEEKERDRQRVIRIRQKLERRKQQLPEGETPPGITRMPKPSERDQKDKPPSNGGENKPPKPKK